MHTDDRHLVYTSIWILNLRAISQRTENLRPSTDPLTTITQCDEVTGKIFLKTWRVSPLNVKQHTIMIIHLVPRASTKFGKKNERKCLGALIFFRTQNRMKNFTSAWFFIFYNLWNCSLLHKKETWVSCHALTSVSDVNCASLRQKVKQAKKLSTVLLGTKPKSSHCGKSSI